MIRMKVRVNSLDDVFDHRVNVFSAKQPHPFFDVFHLHSHSRLVRFSKLFFGSRIPLEGDGMMSGDECDGHLSKSLDKPTKLHDNYTKDTHVAHSCLFRTVIRSMETVLAANCNRMVG